MKNHELLQKYWDRRRKNSRTLSLRGLALKLEVSPSFLSRVLSGKKTLPFDLMLKIAKQLDVESEVVSLLKENYKRENPEPVKTRTEVHSELEEWEMTDKASHRVLREWYYLPILDLTSLKDFDGRIESIARRLGLDLQIAKKACQELIDIGLLKDQDGRLQKAVSKIRWASGRSLEDIRRFHGQMLEKANQALLTQTSTEDFARRLITGITVTASPEKIERAKMKLNEYLHEIANELASEPGTEVYQLSAQLFPLTRKS